MARRLTTALKACHIRRQQTYNRAHPETKQRLVLDPFELLFPVEALLLQGHGVRVEDSTVCHQKDDWNICTRNPAPVPERPTREQALRELQAAFEKSTSESAVGGRGLDSETMLTYTLIGLTSPVPLRWSQGNFDDFAETIGRVVVVSILFELLNMDINDPEGDVLDALVFRPSVITTSRPTAHMRALSRDEPGAILIYAPGSAYLRELEDGLDAFAAGTELLNAFRIKAFETDQESREGRHFANVQCFDKNKRRIDGHDAANANPTPDDVLVGLESFDNARKMLGADVLSGDACAPTEWVHPNTTMEDRRTRLPLVWNSKSTGQPLAVVAHKKPVFATAYLRVYPTESVQDALNSSIAPELMAISHAKDLPSEMDLSFTVLPHVAIQVAAPMTVVGEGMEMMKRTLSELSGWEKEWRSNWRNWGENKVTRLTGVAAEKPAMITPTAAAYDLGPPAPKEGTFTLAVSLKRRAASARSSEIFCGDPVHPLVKKKSHLPRRRGIFTNQEEEEEDLHESRRDPAFANQEERQEEREDFVTRAMTWSDDDTHSSYSLSMLSAWWDGEREEHEGERIPRLDVVVEEEGGDYEETDDNEPFSRKPKQDHGYSQNFALCQKEGRFSIFAQFNIGSEFINAQGQKIEVGKMLDLAGVHVRPCIDTSILLEYEASISSPFFSFVLLVRGEEDSIHDGVSVFHCRRARQHS